MDNTAPRLDTPAWLLDLNGRQHAAVGEFEIIHVMTERPTLFEVPLSPSYCRHALTWQDHIVPVMDIQAFLIEQKKGSQAPVEPTPDSAIAIVAYQAGTDQATQHGALVMRNLPTRSVVRDDQACALPTTQHDGWEWLAISCYDDPAYGATPILDLPRIFSQRPTTKITN